MKTRYYLLILAIFAISFFVLTSFCIYQFQKGNFIKWASPDETANYFFSKLYSREGVLYQFQQYNLEVKEIIHPRSFRSDLGVLKPVSFIGMPLVYGKIASFTTWKVIGYLTPFFAALGIIYYFLLMEIFFSRRVAFLSALLLSIFPVYFYFTERSMFHNVPFVVFLIIGLYYTLISVPPKAQKVEEKPQTAEPGKRKKRMVIAQKAKPKNAAVFTEQVGKVKEKKPNIFLSWTRKFKSLIAKENLKKLFRVDLKKSRDLLYAALGGFFIGLAITFRSSELLWLGPMLVLIWLLNFWRFGLSRLAIFLSFLLLAMMPMFHWNSILYGSPLQGGYPAMNESIASAANSGKELVKSIPGVTAGSLGTAKALIIKLKQTIFSFGLNYARSYKIFKLYYVFMFPWIFWPSIAGMFLFILHSLKLKKKHFAYLLSYAWLSLVLILYYGSWEFYDNPDRSAATIGNSYTRYWLPVYLGALPFVAYFFFKIIDLPKLLIDLLARFRLFKDRVKNWKRLVNIFRFFMVAAVFIIFFQVYAMFLLFGSEEGLVPTYYRGLPSRAEYAKVISLTENNSVLITQYHDKLFFPERRVVMGKFDDPKMIEEYANIAKFLPLYYYNFAYPPAAVEYLNNGILGRAGLKMEKVAMVTKDFTLYKLEPVKNEPVKIIKKKKKKS